MCANISELSIHSKINTGKNDSTVDLNTKSLLELQDLLDRQDTILKNKKFLKLLPDKGEKILKFRTKVENEIHHRKEIARSNELMSCLNISGDKKFVEELEWKSNHHDHSTLDDVENDETDVLKILTESAGLSGCKRENNAATSRKLPENTGLKERLEESSKYPECTMKLIKKTVNEHHSSSKKEPFKPHKSVKNESKIKKHDLEIDQTSHLNKAIKFLDLNESIKVEEEYNEKIQEIKIKYAIERLSATNAGQTLKEASTEEDNLCVLNQEIESPENLSENEQDSEHENNHDY